MLGYSWTRIGSSLGVRRTAAQKRFGGDPTPERQLALEAQTSDLIVWARVQLDGADPADRSKYRRLIDRVTRRRRGEFVDEGDRSRKGDWSR